MSVLNEPGLGFLIHDVTRALRRAFQRSMVGSELTLAQSRALTYITRNEGIRQVELAEMMEVQPITLARLIDQLEELALVERRADPTDRRAYKLYVLEKAQQHVAIIENVLNDMRREAYAGVTEEEIQIVFSVLLRMRDNLTVNYKKALAANG